ncbi:MAG: diguanylate cyclase response regulator [Spirochaetae bacterium HGW-Spirochaetae-7]|jgi:two-component system chemotaxis family response regulator WspR|nr:MAG: diguanylate cyclase response regulator [Spirochaetae bacterium HGW-Spirochaetae-7]
MESEKTILIVDDSASFAAAMVDMLDGEYTSHVARTAEEGLELAGRLRPPIIFLDIVLPDGEGYEVCSRLKMMFAHTPLQIVLMSAAYDANRLDKILAVGADDFIRKPFDALEFQLRLKAAQIRLRSQKQLMDEREFYRQAVRKEEDLTVKLLDRQIGLKETLADLESKRIGLELENTRLAAAARFDVLTGLLNRHSLNARLELEMRRAAEEGAPLTGMMLDLDKFKSINDTFGHVAGDDVLRSMGDALRGCLRREDYAGRYGGEEFFVLLPGSAMSAALAIAERIRIKIAGSVVESAGKKISVTASIGVAPYMSGDAVGDWVGRADAAMYRAKQGGRNRVES